MLKRIMLFLSFALLAMPALAADLTATPSTLSSTLTAAKAGDTITLSSGSYGVLGFVKKTYNPPLVVTSVASAGAPQATIRGLYVSQASGVTFRNLNILAGPAATSNDQTVRIWQSSNINIENSKIVGGLAVTGIPNSSPNGTVNPTGNIIGLPSGKGVNFDTCNTCSIVNSDISLFHKGITFGGSNDLTIDGNKVTKLRTTPISGVPGVNLHITNNFTADSTPHNYGGAGDHGDMLHIWTAGSIVKGLVVTGNQFMQGNGYPMMGLFMQCQTGFFEGAVVSNNTVATSNGQGIIMCMSGNADNNVLIWTKTTASYKDAPRHDIKIGSRDLTVRHTTGGVVTKAKGLPASVVVIK